ncbi:MAG: hypothetical protein ONB17_09210 [candidate division KSB1 bacterium]|nr:hypothetical protein [candidate division KSB1 bacterium]
MNSRRSVGLALVAAMHAVGTAQAQYPWPVTPFTASQEITGTFCEFRDTDPADHFHNGVDIPKPDGTPVYPVQSQRITSLSATGSNAYVRVREYAYVHIQPNPALEVGDQVWQSQTVLGIILTGMGHVHFIDGYSGSEINPLRASGGLTPYVDPYPPIIRFVRLFADGSDREFVDRRVCGLVDIVAKVDEQNGPPDSPVSRRNNGTYKIGYRILTADGSAVVYEPTNDGVRFQFDQKPDDSFVHNVYFKGLSTTSSHVYIVTNAVNTNGYWNTAQVAPGLYQVMVFTEDTRGNQATAAVSVEVLPQDTLPPAVPSLRAVRHTNQGIEVSWYPSLAEDLLGYRLFYSFDNAEWRLLDTESSLGHQAQARLFSATVSRPLYFRLIALDNSPQRNASVPSDVYGLYHGPPPRWLIVDGFDRWGPGSVWSLPAHWFAFIYGQALAAAGAHFHTCSDDAIADRSIQLPDYEAVLWFVGDAGAEDRPLTDIEQEALKNYLRGGGNLLLCGSNVASALDAESGGMGEEFLRLFLKADWVQDSAGTNEAVGAPWSVWEGTRFEYGTRPYPERGGDVIVPVDGGAPCLLYGETELVAGVQFSGFFPDGTQPGKVVFVAIPLETVAGEETLATLCARLCDFFFAQTGVMQTRREADLVPHSPGYCLPNPCNEHTALHYQVRTSGPVVVELFDGAGREVRRFEQGVQPGGWHTLIWDGKDCWGTAVPSGRYLFRVSSADGRTTVPVAVVR